MTLNPVMTIMPGKPLFTNVKQMYVLSFKIIMDKVVPIQLALHKSDLQTKLAPDLPQSIGSKDETSGPDEFYLNVIF